jgi:hypothetical protein
MARRDLLAAQVASASFPGDNDPVAELSVARLSEVSIKRIGVQAVLVIKLARGGYICIHVIDLSSVNPTIACSGRCALVDWCDPQQHVVSLFRIWDGLRRPETQAAQPRYFRLAFD